MGAYCCCGKKIGYIGYSEQDCVCDHTGWIRVEDNLPKKSGLYRTRVVMSSCDRYEVIQKFSTVDQKWEVEGSGDELVYEWKEI